MKLSVSVCSLWVFGGTWNKSSTQISCFVQSFVQDYHFYVSYGKMGNTNVQLALQHCFKASLKAMLCVLSPTDQTCFATEQIRLFQVAREFWLLIRGSHAIHGSCVICYKTPKQVCLGPVKRATCTDCVARSRTSLYFLQESFKTHNNLIWLVTSKSHDV